MKELNYTWVEIDKNTYGSIFTELRSRGVLHVHASYADLDGGIFGGKPEMNTEWGFKDAACPLIRCYSERESAFTEWNHKYYIVNIATS